MSQRLPVTVVDRPKEYSASYAAEVALSETPSSYWCTPSGTAPPVVMTLEVAAFEATVERLVIDTRVKGWETSAVKRVVVEVSPPSEPEGYAQVADLELGYDALQHVVLAEALPAGRVRLTMLSNHGGQYFALQRLHVFGKALGVGDAVHPLGTRVTSGEREGAVTGFGYEVLFDGDNGPSWVPAAALSVVEGGAKKKPVKGARKKKAAR